MGLTWIAICRSSLDHDDKRNRILTFPSLLRLAPKPPLQEADFYLSSRPPYLSKSSLIVSGYIDHAEIHTTHCVLATKRYL